MKPYKTKDMPFAAYLMLRGYTCLGSVKTGESNSVGHQILELVLVHTDFKDDYDAMRDDILKHQETFHTESKGFREYYSKIKLCRRKLEEPVDPSEVE